IREMMLPGAIALIVPLLVGFGFQNVFEDTSSPEILGGLLAGVTVSGVLLGMFQNNAGGAWDNAKKSFEAGVEIDGKMEFKGSDAHKASVTGDTVGDPFKDTSGPSMNILIKLMSIVSLVIAPHLNTGETGHTTNTPAATGMADGAVMIVMPDGNVMSAKVDEARYASLEPNKIFELELHLDVQSAPDGVDEHGWENVIVHIPGEASYLNGYIVGEGMFRTNHDETPVFVDVILTKENIVSGRVQLH